jgi:hypothetical protein
MEFGSRVLTVRVVFDKSSLRWPILSTRMVSCSSYGRWLLSVRIEQFSIKTSLVWRQQASIDERTTPALRAPSLAKEGSPLGAEVV